MMLQAYNDWAIDEWCGAYPGRFIPLGIVPMWDVDLAVKEVHRVAKKGCRSISFLEAPHAQGFPSFLSGHWDPMLAGAVRRGHGPVACTSAPASSSSRKPPEAPIDHLIVLACQISAIIAQDLLFGPTLRRFPDLKVALSEGGIGWIPFYLDRIDRHFKNQAWLHERLRRQAALGGLPRAHPGLLHHRPVRAGAPRPDRHRHHRLGVRLPPHRHDVARVARVRLEGARRTPACTDEEIHKITWENACRFFDWDPFKHTPKEQATVGALRALARDVDTTRMPTRGVAQAQRGRRHRRLLEADPQPV